MLLFLSFDVVICRYNSWSYDSHLVTVRNNSEDENLQAVDGKEEKQKAPGLDA